jgi:hypothetical protein
MVIRNPQGGSPPEDQKVVVRQTDARVSSIDPEVVSAAELVLVRAVRTYLQALVGFLVVGFAAGLIPFVDNPIAATDFVHKLGGAASLAVAPAVISILQNAIELLGKLDVHNPRLRG